ncbi:hypothetical protein ACFFS2_24220 [Streptomyces aurantiacus]|nr:hypothetical protein [Streptomyces aurantiacus]
MEQIHRTEHGPEIWAAPEDLSDAWTDHDVEAVAEALRAGGRFDARGNEVADRIF